MRVVVTGLIATYPLGGVAWDYLAYVSGFRQLGCEVLYLEDTGQWLYDPRRQTFTDDVGFGIDYLTHTLALARGCTPLSWALRAPDGSHHGRERAAVIEFCRRADLFLNVSGSCWLREEYRDARCIAYLDTDPGYTQAKLAAADDGIATADDLFSVRLIRAHQRFFTLAENIGESDCSLPHCGLTWIPTRQPLVIEDWPFTFTPEAQAFSTVMSWKIDVTPPTLGGVSYGGKNDSFTNFLDMPARSTVALEVAVSGAAPTALLQKHGWQVVDGHIHSHTPDVYRDYLRCSRGEWSIAKQAYVALRSGWFSTRSVAYLALGKPVVVQDTGWSRQLPTGDGLFAFDTVEQAAEALTAIESAYLHHCDASRSIAEREFAAGVVLRKLLADAGLA
jgi:hypothetical protein